MYPKKTVDQKVWHTNASNPKALQVLTVIYFSRLISHSKRSITMQTVENCNSRKRTYFITLNLSYKLTTTHLGLANQAQGKNHTLMKIAKPICRTKAAACIRERSFVCMWWFLRFNATKPADAPPVSNMMIHFRNSTGIIKRNCNIKKGSLYHTLTKRREQLKSLQKMEAARRRKHENENFHIRQLYLGI